MPLSCPSSCSPSSLLLFLSVLTLVVLRGVSSLGQPLPPLDSPLPVLTQQADVVFQGRLQGNNATTIPAQFLVIAAYKGGQYLASEANFTERQVAVRGWAGYTAAAAALPGAPCLVFCDATLNECTALSWTRDAETRLWAALGWSDWNAWTPCSASCGNGGSQERRRTCRDRHCSGHAVETRRCNFFSCLGAVSPLMTSEPRGQFHPARRLWHRPPERPSAWRLLPDAYVWVPSAQLFPRTGVFPESFAVLMTIRVLEQPEGARGALFSLSSRRQPDAYLSLELAGSDSLRLVHASHGTSRSVNIPAHVADGNWHWLALSVRDHSAVTAYMDCAWLSTELLPHNALDTPADADLVIGYLFQGDLEQLLVSTDPEAVSQQCSHPEVVPPPLSEQHLSTTVPPPPPHAASKPIQPDYGRPFEVEWSSWSECNATCGQIGQQTRHSRCLDRQQLELCLESGGEVTQTRECAGSCGTSASSSHRQRGGCHCLNGGVCHKKHTHCHCPPQYMGRRCQLRRPSKTGPVHNCSCHHGTCGGTQRICRCFPGYTGSKCDVRFSTLHGGKDTPPLHKSRSPASCTESCMNGGSCVDGECFCTEGYSGPTCSKPRCDTPCQNQGTCLGPDRCLCRPDYTGAYCELRLCPEAVIEEDNDLEGRSKRQLFLPRFTPLVPQPCP